MEMGLLCNMVIWFMPSYFSWRAAHPYMMYRLPYLLLCIHESLVTISTICRYLQGPVEFSFILNLNNRNQAPHLHTSFPAKRHNVAT